ncbi:undecaprenyl-phosphate galactose phosphotransferase WbaP [Klebsiella variicola]|jgi:Undecaprenyl-phosphate galactose phosphotransferase WbaP|uniref:undecaprenyl-phosphate galactose phosphotransferase WbaP n=1 Tax=Klebsiella TaxID=570 RepID=UPI00073BFD86|nr:MULTISPECIES: undecaprenyl-phosphate galactose phosphotransferase WbaP [Klebsiella]HCI6743150.1 undecaprenyl-phosphate galactose phosphotransferase WbaP [Klebsiella variicola subsp. variicola]KSZ17512.1 UDP-phosphate galactose phosphotransferase [Klebsiella variicola]MBQ5273759.1 undecaprenyl-phosphate galactose phosphotransferase WbaP [Klebsiella quasipneumoniae]MCC5461311.1 undecaprenyl-phosphate galactose phosphotransferase WbaP [Klebsiella quasipneumoniae subsp. similipneumoniae]PJX3228
MTLLGRNIIVSTALAISDLFSFMISLYLSLNIFSMIITDYDKYVHDNPISQWIALHWILAICCVAWYSMRLRHYFYRKTFWFELKEILRTLVIFAIIEIAVMAFATWSFSRSLWILTWIFIMMLVPLARMLTKRTLDFFGLWRRDTWIIGSGPNAQEAYRAISSERNLGLVIVGFISGDEDFDDDTYIDNLPVLKRSPSWLTNIDKKTQFIVAVESHQSDLRNKWLRTFMINGYRYVSVIPTLRGMPLDSTDMSFIFSHEVMIFRVQQNLAKWSSRILKRAFDIFGSLAIIIVLSPLLLYISRKVKKDGGPAIYGHERIGKGGVPFKCLKFRSMVINSKEVLTALLESDPESKKEWDETFKLKNDPRITKIGGVLRRTSLDELPQLFNVLKGEMSLVGPRPIITAELERYNEEVEYYLLSKPGMTGLWQVSGRSDVDYETRVYLDAWYVKNWSMWNDIAILFKTISVVLRKDGAY